MDKLVLAAGITTAVIAGIAAVEYVMSKNSVANPSSTTTNGGVLSGLGSGLFAGTATDAGTTTGAGTATGTTAQQTAAQNAASLAINTPTAQNFISANNLTAVNATVTPQVNNVGQTYAYSVTSNTLATAQNPEGTIIVPEGANQSYVNGIPQNTITQVAGNSSYGLTAQQTAIQTSLASNAKMVTTVPNSATPANAAQATMVYVTPTGTRVYYK